MHEVRGVVSKGKGAPVTVETIVVPDPGPGEALVDVQACGVCHTDLHYREGGINDDFPFLLGHEAAGWSSRPSARASPTSRPATTSSSTGARSAASAVPAAADAPGTASPPTTPTQKMTLADGTELSPALGIGAFVEKTLVAAGQCTKVNADAAPEVAGLLGCGVMAGIGAAINTGGVTRGDSVAVFGCGGVGDAAIAGARLAGAHTIIAVDVDDRKLQWASEFGATHTVNAKNDDPVDAIKRITDGTAPTSASRRSATRRRSSRPTTPATSPAPLVLVGVPTPDMQWTTPLHRHLRPRRLDQVVVVRRLPSRAATSRC